MGFTAMTLAGANWNVVNDLQKARQTDTFRRITVYWGGSKCRHKANYWSDYWWSAS